MTLDLGDVTDLMAGCLIQVGNYLKIRKKATGWACSCVAIVYWVFRSHSTGFAMQEFWHMVSFLMASFGYLTWVRNNK
jgi:hypothetical protein